MREPTSTSWNSSSPCVIFEGELPVFEAVEFMVGDGAWWKRRYHWILMVLSLSYQMPVFRVYPWDAFIISTAWTLVVLSSPCFPSWSASALGFSDPTSGTTRLFSPIFRRKWAWQELGVAAGPSQPISVTRGRCSSHVWSVPLGICTPL